MVYFLVYNKMPSIDNAELKELISITDIDTLKDRVSQLVSEGYYTIYIKLYTYLGNYYKGKFPERAKMSALAPLLISINDTLNRSINMYFEDLRLKERILKSNYQGDKSTSKTDTKIEISLFYALYCIDILDAANITLHDINNTIRSGKYDNYSLLESLMDKGVDMYKEGRESPILTIFANIDLATIKRLNDKYTLDFTFSTIGYADCLVNWVMFNPIGREKELYEGILYIVNHGASVQNTIPSIYENIANLEDYIDFTPRIEFIHTLGGSLRYVDNDFFELSEEHLEYMDEDDIRDQNRMSLYYKFLLRDHSPTSLFRLAMGEIMVAGGDTSIFPEFGKYRPAFNYEMYSDEIEKSLDSANE